MLKSLKLTNLGPTKDLDIQFGDRLTVITGDNSLGKSFILDTAWWALTGVWPAEINPDLSSGIRARPNSEDSEISYSVSGNNNKPKGHKSKFDIKKQKWSRPQARPTNPGLVVYAMADGAFSVWDPARNYWNRPSELVYKLPAYVFSNKQVWQGLFLSSEGKSLCEGLIRDVAKWVKTKKNINRHNLDLILRTLSPSEDSPITLGDIYPN